MASWVISMDFPLIFHQYPSVSPVFTGKSPGQEAARLRRLRRLGAHGAHGGGSADVAREMIYTSPRLLSDISCSYLIFNIRGYIRFLIYIYIIFICIYIRYIYIYIYVWVYPHLRGFIVVVHHFGWFIIVDPTWMVSCTHFYRGIIN